MPAIVLIDLFSDNYITNQKIKTKQKQKHRHVNNGYWRFLLHLQTQIKNDEARSDRKKMMYAKISVLFRSGRIGLLVFRSSFLNIISRKDLFDFI